MTEHLVLLSETKCGYCGVMLNSVRASQWDGGDDSFHYKHVDCEGCNRKNWERVDFHGSGHDRSDDCRTIESILNKVQEK